MTTTLEREQAPFPEFDLKAGRLAAGRKWRNRFATVFMIGAFFVAAIPLFFVLLTVVTKGLSVISADWFTADIPDVASSVLASKFGATDVAPVVYGMAPAIVGTLLTTGLATLIAVPLGILGAIYLNEYGRQRRFAQVLRFFTDVMIGVPSVIMGVFLYAVWVVPRGVDGRSAVAGGLALACLMLPIVVRSTEEMLKLVPDHLREASLALGSRTSRATMTVVVPAALPGITSGCMLAIARAAGETAPLLLTIGSTRFLNAHFSGVNTALSTQIFSNVTQPGGEPLAWGAALTLIALVLIFTLLARFVTSRFALAQS
ncbi:MAG TPA: phosphate ABC transporter permease PstA [Acidimicrobiales bacterium]|jgi:phosphate transport system permease protein